MELKIRKMADICPYRPCWICHILIQQRSIIKSTLKTYSLASLFCCCICKILACCIVEEKMKLKIRKIPKSAYIGHFDMPYFNTTKVSRQVNFENTLYSVSFLWLHMQNFGMLYHSGKMKLEMQRRPKSAYTGHIGSAIFRNNNSWAKSDQTKTNCNDR